MSATHFLRVWSIWMLIWSCRAFSLQPRAGQPQNGDVCYLTLHRSAIAGNKIYFMGGKHTVQGGVTNKGGSYSLIFSFSGIHFFEQNRSFTHWTLLPPSHWTVASLEVTSSNHLHPLTRIGTPPVFSLLMPRRLYCTPLEDSRQETPTQTLYLCTIRPPRVGALPPSRANLTTGAIVMTPCLPALEAAVKA